jgi:glycosyltransferase involved in cell wall biosynthesis
MIKVSVILPIYNVASYLDETFQSVINQSLKEIEIIAVNDGSTDNSEEIIEKYKQKDSRILSFSQENQGLSVTRNVALKHASGEYIYMMDSDDILSNPDALQLCYEYAQNNKADFIFFDGERFSEKDDCKNSNIQRTHLVEENIQYNGNYLLNLMLDKRIHNSVVWLLFINHNYMRKLGLSFYPGIIHEDELFTTILTLNSDSIYCIKQSLIKHRIRSTSIMGQKFTKRNLDCYLTVIDELFKFQNSDIIKKFSKYTLSKVFYTGHQIPFKDKPKLFWRAFKSGYLKYIGVKSCFVFWLKK